MRRIARTSTTCVVLLIAAACATGSPSTPGATRPGKAHRYQEAAARAGTTTVAGTPSPSPSPDPGWRSRLHVKRSPAAALEVAVKVLRDLEYEVATVDRDLTTVSASRRTRVNAFRLVPAVVGGNYAKAEFQEAMVAISPAADDASDIKILLVAGRVWSKGPPEQYPAEDGDTVTYTEELREALAHAFEGR
jgi:hypothetical protein